MLPINGRLEAMNSLSNVIYGVKKQLADQESFSGKLEDDDKQTLLAVGKETMEQVAGEGATALLEAVEEKLAQVRAQINLLPGNSTKVLVDTHLIPTMIPRNHFGRATSCKLMRFRTSESSSHHYWIS